MAAYPVRWGKHAAQVRRRGVTCYRWIGCEVSERGKERVGFDVPPLDGYLLTDLAFSQIIPLIGSRVLDDGLMRALKGDERDTRAA